MNNFNSIVPLIFHPSLLAQTLFHTHTPHTCMVMCLMSPIHSLTKTQMHTCTHSHSSTKQKHRCAQTHTRTHTHTHTHMCTHTHMNSIAAFDCLAAKTTSQLSPPTLSCEAKKSFPLSSNDVTSTKPPIK